MTDAIIYGCGNVGRIAYEYYKNKYNILFFVDKNKCGEIYENCAVYDTKELVNHADTKIIIAVSPCYYQEILENIDLLGVKNSDIELFKIDVSKPLPYRIEKELDQRTIDLGCFLHTNNTNFSCRELTFLSGGSQILDYVFLKTIALVSGAKEYLEVGTYIGESINVMSECCERLYSVTAPIGTEYSMRNWCKTHKMPDYSERLTYSQKITHYYGDSKEFDFSKHGDTVDLYFIDGDHSYNGVYCDTQNIFQNKKDDAIVVWHDFKIERNQYNAEVVTAVSDVLGKEFENVYVTNNNMCGIYIPPKRIKEFNFVLRERKYEEDAPLYTYDIMLNNLCVR